MSRVVTKVKWCKFRGRQNEPPRRRQSSQRRNVTRAVSPKWSAMGQGRSNKKRVVESMFSNALLALISEMN